LNRNKRKNARFDERVTRCRDRALAVWSCVSVLRPDLSPKEKEKLAKKVLKLAARKGKLAITPAATEEIVMSNLQCISKNCPMLLFSEPLSRAINLYFGEE
jgi:hypothetical protein